MVNSRLISDLHPKVQPLANKLISECLLVGIDLIITSTYRDKESQNELYKIGRTVKGSGVTLKKPMGNKVTNAKGGDSFHNYKVAFDVVPVINGKAIWNDNDLWIRIGKLGKSIGLEWAGDWVSFKETAHFQFTNNLKLIDFKAGKSL